MSLEVLKRKKSATVSRSFVAGAADRDLPIGDMPQWAENLNSLHYRNSLHDRPYPLRYPEELNVLTDAHQTELELRNLIDTVRKRMDAL